MKHSIGSGNRTQAGLRLACALALCLVCVSRMDAQAAAPQQKPAPTPAAGSANPFPEDTKDVPVMPSNPTALSMAQGDADGAAPMAMELPARDLDPVRSPDEGGGAGETEAASGFSSSRTGLESILPDPNAPEQGRRGRRGAAAVPEHTETAEEDVSVGKYYLDNKNWKAAQSRFQSALVLSPENPDVYWGLAESARHLGDIASARANYQKVIEYDPDSRHAKEAAKTLKTPEMAEKTASKGK